MKKTLITILCLQSLVYAQLNADIGIGTDTKHLTTKLELGYTYQRVNASIVENPSLSRDINAHKYFGANIGYDIGFLIPSVGYYFDYLSADKKYLNTAGWGYSLKAYKMINDRGGLYVSTFYYKKFFQIGAGIHYIFVR